MNYYTTKSRWVVAVETGMPTDPVRVGQGQSRAEAEADLAATPMQSCGRDNGRRDALEWASHQPGAGFRVVPDKRFTRGFRLEDRD